MTAKEREKPHGFRAGFTFLRSLATALISYARTARLDRDDQTTQAAIQLGPTVAEIYHQRTIADPEKHIEEMAATGKPFANVPLDMID